MIKSSSSSGLKSGKEIASSVFRFSPIRYNHIKRNKTFRKIFLADFFLKWSSREEKRISIIFLYTLPSAPRGGEGEGEKGGGGVSSRVDTGNIRKEMEISSGGGDKGEVRSERVEGR